MYINGTMDEWEKTGGNDVNVISVVTIGDEAIFWLLCAIAAGMIGKTKGEPCLGFVIGALLGPLGILAALLSRGNRRPCLCCKEAIHKEAQICPYCHSVIPKP
jgi:hypothetical protein